MGSSTEMCWDKKGVVQPEVFACNSEGCNEFFCFRKCNQAVVVRLEKVVCHQGASQSVENWYSPGIWS